MKKAVLVGINYKGTEHELFGCVNDVNNMANLLIQKFGFSPLNVRILSDEKTPPTRLNIQAAIGWLVQRSRPGDVLVFHFSGHGAWMFDRSRDESDNQDEIMVPIDYKTQGFISDDWMYQNLVSRVPRGVQLWCFADACHSGTFFDLRYGLQYKPIPTRLDSLVAPSYNSADWGNQFIFQTEKSREVGGTVCSFSGALDNQKALDGWIDGKSQGVFTSILLMVLKQMPRNSPMTVQELLKCINCVLLMKGFTNQNTQLSVGKLQDLEIRCTL